MAEPLARGLLATYRLAGYAASPLAGALIHHRARRGKEDLKRQGERYGHGAMPKPAGSLVWVHAASVGETVAILPLIERIEAAGSNVLLTTGTVTSADLAARRIGPGTIHQYVPIDLAPFINRFLAHWRPQLAVFVESELWPATFHALAKRNIPHVLVNARMSQRSFERWRKASGIINAILERVTLCLAQTVDDGERFRVLGAPRVRVTGNLKFDTPAPKADPDQLEGLQVAFGLRPLWLASSTHPGEEAAVLRAHVALKASRPDLLTIIVPRHPERGPEVMALAEEMGTSPVLRSSGKVARPMNDVYVADTIGEMGLFYRLAPVCFVGGSLVKHGGQNPIEPAKLGAAILHGPDTHNFPEIYAALRAGGASIDVDGPQSLMSEVGTLLSDNDKRERLCFSAKRAISQFEGALDSTVDAIEPLLMAFSVSAALRSMEA